MRTASPPEDRQVRAFRSATRSVSSSSIMRRARDSPGHVATMAPELQHEEPTRGKGFSHMARKKRQYGSGCLLKRGKGWAIRWREMEIAPDGTRKKVLRYETLGEVTRKQASNTLAQRLAAAGNDKGRYVLASRSGHSQANGTLRCCRCTSTRPRSIVASC